MKAKVGSTRIENAREFPKVYYGLHFYPGVAEYRHPGKEPYRIYVTEDAIRKMQPSFAGKPLYVRHVNEVNLPTLEDDMDGVVVKTFFNKADGKHWTQFVVTTDKGHQAIRQDWKLSNCYVPTAKGGKGIHNGLEYDEELLDGQYEHLALVNDPRYEESVIYTPEQFKEYNSKKELELQRLANSNDKKTKVKKENQMKLFKRAEVQDSEIDLDDTLVVLPKSKREISLANAIDMADKLENMHGYANADHMVKVGEEEMSVGKLTKNYLKMKANESDEDGDEDDKKENTGQEEKEEPELKNKKKKNAKKKNKSDEDDGDEDDKKKNKKKNSRDEDDEDEELDEDIVIENSSDDDDEDEDDEQEKRSSKRKNARDDDDEEDDEDGKGHFHKLLNAGDRQNVEEEEIEMSHTRIARGKDRY